MKFLIFVWGLSRLSVDSLNLLVWVEDPALPSFWPATIRTVWLMDGSAGGGGLPGTRAGPKHRLSRPDSSAGPWGTVHWSRILPCDCLQPLFICTSATQQQPQPVFLLHFSAEIHTKRGRWKKKDGAKTDEGSVMVLWWRSSMACASDSSALQQACEH